MTGSPGQSGAQNIIRGFLKVRLTAFFFYSFLLYILTVCIFRAELARRPE
jgi:hypothetical protein